MTGKWTLRQARQSMLMAFAIFSSATAVRADDPPSTDLLLPVETYLYVTCPSVEALKERFSESAFGRLWQDSSMRNFREEFDKGREKVAEEFQSKIGLPLIDVLELPKGEVTFAMSRADAGPPAPILLMDVGDDQETLEAVLDKIDESLEQQEATKSTENVDGVELTIFTLKQAEGAGARGGANSPRTVAYFVKETFVVASLNTTLLKGVLARWDGSNEDTFGEKSVFPEIVSACRENDDSESDLYYFIDPVGLVMASMAANPQAAAQAAIVGIYLPQLGLNKLKGIGGAFTFDSEDFDTVSRTMIYIEPSVSGLLKFFRMPAKSQSPPAWVSQDVDQYSSLSWDPQGAYTTIGEVYGIFTGNAAGFDAAVEQIASHPSNPGIHPRKDFFDQMTGSTEIVGFPVAENSTGQQQMLFALGIKNDVAMQSVIEKIAARTPQLQKRDFEGTTIYEVSGQESDPDAPSPAIAVSRGMLFIATHVQALEETLRGGTSTDEPLSASDDYRAVAKHFPSQTSAIGYTKSASQIRALWNQARSGGLGDQFSEIDFSKLPEFSAVEKYFSLGGSYLTPVDKGAMFIQFSLPVE